MDKNSKDIFNLYKKQIINENVGDQVPFSKPKVTPSKVQKKATQLKGQAGDLTQQAQQEAPTVSSDQIERQAQPLVSNANKEAEQVLGQPAEPTQLTDIPRFGESELISWKESDFPEMNIRQVEEQAEAAYDLKESFLLIGDPGIGKSSIFARVAKRIAEEKNREYVNFFDLGEQERDAIIQNPSSYFVYVDLRLAEMDKSDVVGIPVKTDKPYTVYNPPSWAYLLTREGADGFLFLDEFNQGSKEVKDAAFKIVLDRVLGDKRLANDVGIVAACNMGEIFGNEPITPANINRFGAGVLVVNPDQWREYAVEAGIEDAIIAFTKAIPEDALYKEPNGENPFVTPRVLEKISKGIQYFRKKHDEAVAQGKRFNTMEHIRIFSAQRAGVQWANRFDTFLKHIQSFDIGKIVKDPKKYLKDQPLDKSIALVVFVVSKVKTAVNNAKASGGQITPEDFEILSGVAKIMNNLSKEAVCIMFEYMKKEIQPEYLGFLLDFLVEENYDAAVKKEFLETVLPQIRKIMKGESCSTK